jgi:hypothetical protein
MGSRNLRFLAGAVLGLFANAAASSFSLAQQASPPGGVIKLNQGWSDDDRLQYYNAPQGSAAVPYDLYLNLEAADSADLFRSDKIAESYGMIPQPPNAKYNPDGLPVGIDHTKVASGQFKGEWAGITCAACHNGQLHYKGMKIQIDGGVNTGFDFSRFAQGLGDALAATAASPEKFDRLAARLNAGDATAKAELRTRLQKTSATLHYFNTISMAAPSPAGPARIDAVGEVHNYMIAAMGTPENWLPSLAPAKFPFVWNAPQSSWVQWTGFLNDPLNRNTAESIGVFAKEDLTSKTPDEGLFDSTVDIKGVIAIENLLRRVAPPKWPEDVLGAIDRQKAAAGAALFKQNCAGCHSVWPHRWSDVKLEGKRFIENALVPVDVIGTDKTHFGSAPFDKTPSHLTGAIGAYLDAPQTGAAVSFYPAIARSIQRGINNKILGQIGLTDAEIEDARGFRSPDEKAPVQPVYKAGPRDGAWATPPFLHNGSVPSLYELLLPAAQRSKTFFLGRDFDPVKLGVDTSGDSGKFLYDTTLLGNSNAGHSFQDGPRGNGVIGRLLTDDQRWELIEYLKSIPTEEGQVTPYGGPKNPVEAWKDPTFYNVRHSEGYSGN